MNNIKIEKNELLTILENNRVVHAEIVKEAEEGYRKHVLKTLKSITKNISKGGKIEPFIRFTEPANHLEDYDRAIKMLKMTLDTVIELNEREFRQFVEDDWDWKENFFASNKSYSASAFKMSQS